MAKVQVEAASWLITLISKSGLLSTSRGNSCKMLPYGAAGEQGCNDEQLRINWTFNDDLWVAVWRCLFLNSFFCPIKCSQLISYTG